MTPESVYQDTYDNNLLFYTLLKTLVQCKLSDAKLVELQATLSKNRSLFANNVEGLRSFLNDSESIVRYDASKRDAYTNLINYLRPEKYDAWHDMLDAGIDLLLFKDLILQEAKAYTNMRQQEAEKSIHDHLSVRYDASLLCVPYGQRVLGSLLVHALTQATRKSEFLLESSGAKVKEISDKIIQLEKYKVNCNNMLILIVAESINQSVVSDAGSSYENRVEYMVRPLVESWSGHSHDENIKAMEYDFTFTLNGKRAGISAKRTLRERYKQNHEDVDLLAVDYVFVITLGTDLNAEKVESILQKKGTYIVVSQEVYAVKDYLRNNPRVISSANLSTECLSGIMQ